MDTGKRIAVLILLITIGISVKMIMDQRDTPLDSPKISGESSSWLYRRTIAIDNENLHSLIEYDFDIIVDTKELISLGKMLPDCKDIRFLDEDSETPLNYSLPIDGDEKCNEETTKITVEIPYIPKGGKNIYFLYGNTSAPQL